MRSGREERAEDVRGEMELEELREKKKAGRFKESSGQRHFLSPSLLATLCNLHGIFLVLNYNPWSLKCDIIKTKINTYERSLSFVQSSPWHPLACIKSHRHTLQALDVLATTLANIPAQPSRESIALISCLYFKHISVGVAEVRKKEKKMDETKCVKETEGLKEKKKKKTERVRAVDKQGGFRGNRWLNEDCVSVWLRDTDIHLDRSWIISLPLQ